MINKRKVRRFVSLMVFLGLLLAIMLVSCNMLGGNTLKVGLYESSRPLTFLDEKKTISGFEVDFAKLLAENLDRKLKIKLLDPENMVNALEDGSVDCIISVRKSVHNLIENFRSTEPFISYGVVIVVQPDNETLLDENDLHKHNVGVMINTDAELLCEEFLKTNAFNVRKYDIESQPFHDLTLKQNHAVIADELYSRFMQKENPDSYKILEPVYVRKQFGLKLSRKLTQDDIQKIESEILKLKSDSAFKALYLDWFGHDLG